METLYTFPLSKDEQKGFDDFVDLINMNLEDILNRIDELNSMCNYDCYYYDCSIDCSHTECYKNRCQEMSILDKELFKWLE